MKLEQKNQNLKPYSAPQIVQVGDVVKTTQGPYFFGIITDFVQNYVYRY